MKIEAVVPDEFVNDTARKAAEKSVSGEIARMFGDSYSPGEATIAVRDAVRECVRSLPLREIVAAEVKDRLALVVRERVERAIAAAVDAEIKRRKAEGDAAQGEIAL